ncbi:phosphoribosylformylglycinamidine cyclo-ligase [Baekduia sp. Peel2402]|uniref:phosphoribosylformylglycinamidine cyclo-ligase n=1 Tax=Baekduia sp. Peel2402 TaxID=3458296 RepID=UPI00403EE1BC
MSDAYAAAGVDTDQADAGVGALVSVLRTIETGSPSRSVVPSGHYASVLRVTDELGIAIATDGVGSKLVVAEQADRLETVGIDCVAMNVNDLICVGAEPIALVDYLAVEEVDAGRLARIGVGLKVGAEAAGCEIPGGELAVLPELIKGHPSPHGFDLCATAIGTVAIKDLVLGDRIAPGDAIIGVPSSGLHSNGYTLARRVLEPLGLDAKPTELEGASVADALLEPTVIYVRAALDLLRSEVDVRGLSHITGGGLNNMLRIGSGYEISDPLPVPPVFGLIHKLGDVETAEMWEVFNMGCGLVAIVPDADADAATEILAARHPGARRIGTTTDTGTVTVPELGLTFPLR